MRSDSNEYPAVRQPAALEGRSRFVVRPDTAVMSFSVSVEEAPREGVQRLRAHIEAVRARLEKAGANIRLHDFTCERAREKSSVKRKRGGSDGVTPARCVVSGEVRMTLPEAFWDRAAVVAGLTTLAQSIVGEAEAMDPPLRVSYQAPVAVVDDPEAHREALITQWTERARALAAQAQSTELSLHLRALDPPGAVQQRPRSLEEVELRLALSGRLDAAPA